MENRKFNNRTTIRVVGSSKEGYTVIPNTVMNDLINIGGNSFIVLAKTLQYAHSPGHTITVKGLSKVLPLSVNVISKALNNLIELGYARRRIIYNGNLKSGYDYEVTTIPFDFDNDNDHLFLDNVESIENAKSSRNHKKRDTDRSHDMCEHETYDIINKIGNKENKEDEEEATKSKPIPTIKEELVLNMYYNDFQLEKKKLPHAIKLLKEKSILFDTALWEEIFISASADTVNNKYKYVRAMIEDLVKDKIFSLEEYKKRADQKKSAINPNNSIRQIDKKYTGNNQQKVEGSKFDEKPTKVEIYNSKCNSKVEIGKTLVSAKTLQNSQIEIMSDYKQGTNNSGLNPHKIQGDWKDYIEVEKITNTPKVEGESFK